MVAFLKKFTKTIGGSNDEDVEEYLDTLGIESEHLLREEADMWIVPHVLQDVRDIAGVIEDIQAGNEVILNIEPLHKRNAMKLKQAIAEIKGTVKSLNGDIARLDEHKILITPKGVKFKRGKK